MSPFEHSDGDKIQKPAPTGDSTHVNAARNEHAPGTEIRSSRPDKVSKREEEMFGKDNGFSFAEHASDSGKQKVSEKAQKESAPAEKAARKGHDAGEEPQVLNFDEKQKPAGSSAKPTAEHLKGVDGMIETAREYWHDAASKGRAEGGVSGHVSALGAEAMGLGVEAFEAGHNLINKVFPDGIVDPAKNYWHEMSKEGKTEGGVIGGAKNITGKVMSGLLDLSGIGEVEKGFDKVVKDVDNVVPESQFKADFRSLTIDTVLAAATFIPGVTGAKAIGKGEAVYKTARAGTEIAGMAAAESRLAESVANKLSKVALEALPASGEELSKTSLENFVAKLEGVAREYGIELKEGGIIGESKGGINAIEYSAKAGGPHEVAHVAQQLQTRATALESQAASLGKNVGELTQAERSAAYENIVKPFEDIAYNQHEMWAGQAHSWGKTSAEYRETILSNWKDFEKALSSATVPDTIVDRASRAYGSLANWLGRSQKEIAKNISSPTSAIIARELD